MRVFLSYGHDEHASLAQQIKRDLQKRGHYVWFDLDCLKAGVDWEAYIEDGLNKVSAKPDEGRFLLIMTPYSVRRPDGFCLNELTRAIQRKLPIIPVMLLDCEPPLSICRLQWLDMRDCVPAEDRPERYAAKFSALVEALKQGQVKFEGEQARLLSHLEPIEYDQDLAQHLARFTVREDLAALIAETNLSALFEKLFVTLLARVSAPPRRTVILIDALDEATERGQNPLARQIGSEFERTPKWLRLIITSRPHEAEINFSLQALDPWILQAGAPENRDDIQAFLQHELRPFTGNGKPSAHVVETILRKSEGLFLYVESVRKELAAGRLSLDRVEEFPQGLGGFYAGSFRRYFPDPEEFASTYRPALEAICAAREPLELDELSSLLSWPVEERVYKKKRLAKALGSLFPVSDGHIRPFHQSVRDWLSSERRAGSYFTSAEEGNRRLAEYGWKQYLSGVGQMSRYSVVHLPAHLSMFPDRKQDLQRVLLDFDWIQAKLNAADVTAIVSDFDLAMSTHAEALSPGKSVAGGRVRGQAVQRDEPLRLVDGTLKLSAHVLVTDKAQLRSQLYGRLLPHSVPEIDGLREQMARRTDQIWLRLMTPTLTPAGGPLVRVLAGHTGDVTAVAVTPDGKQALSASWDQTVKVWDVASGNLAASFTAEGRVWACAIAPDARTIVAGDALGCVHFLKLEQPEARQQKVRRHRGDQS